MDTVVISSERPFVFESIAKVLSAEWPVDYSDVPFLEPVVAVDAKQSRVYLHLGDEPEEEGKFTLFMDYSDVELAKQVLVKFADDHSLLVDNDLGTILPGDEFVARIVSNLGWNWRNPSRSHV